MFTFGHCPNQGGGGGPCSNFLAICSQNKALKLVNFYSNVIIFVCFLVIFIMNYINIINIIIITIIIIISTIIIIIYTFSVIRAIRRL